MIFVIIVVAADQEWFGLNGQYTFLSFHCLDPRYHQDHPSKNGTVGQMAFRFEQIPDAKTERAIWDRLPGGYCEPRQRLFAHSSCG